MSVEPTGTVSREGDRHVLTITREFKAPIEDVWAAVTEPERLARWIGTFTGDPRSGRVWFQMTVEDDAPGDDMVIRECVPPRLLKVTTTNNGASQWHLDLALDEQDGVTTLTFVQPFIDPVGVESVGPGWEFYLDRLVAAETGGDVEGIDFDRDYYPAMMEHYRAQAR